MKSDYIVKLSCMLSIAVYLGGVALHGWVVIHLDVGTIQT